MIDTHSHIDAEEFGQDIEKVIANAQEAGVRKIFLPAIDCLTSRRIIEICKTHKGVCYPMLGIHPESVEADWRERLSEIKPLIDTEKERIIAIGEVGLDFYWSRQYEKEQIAAFEMQVEWAAQLKLPLMIHSRKSQNELVRIIRKYEKDLVGGVFHCFTGNEHEAAELLQFEKFALGIGGVLTFKSSKLPDTLAACVPLDRIVLETDAPYMAPVPYRGKRNEPAYIRAVCEKIANVYNTTFEDADRITTDNAKKIFKI